MYYFFYCWYVVSKITSSEQGAIMSSCRLGHSKHNPTIVHDVQLACVGMHTHDESIKAPHK